jgi:hypothetical protein
MLQTKDASQRPAPEASKGTSDTRKRGITHILSTNNGAQIAHQNSDANIHDRRQGGTSIQQNLNERRSLKAQWERAVRLVRRQSPDTWASRAQARTVKVIARPDDIAAHLEKRVKGGSPCSGS